MELSNSGPMRIKPGLRPQHIYSSVLEKASWASESHPPAVLSVLANALVIKEWPSGKSDL